MKLSAMRFALTFLVVLSVAGRSAADSHRVELCHRTGSEKNPTVSLRVALAAVEAHLAHGDTLGPCDCSTLPDDLMICGGFAGLPCPPGATCIDDPRDDCDPATGGADCSGLCVIPLTDPTPAVCPPGFVEVDDETDDCHPDCGDPDCRTICVATDGSLCEGFAGFVCLDPAFPDCGNTLDGCDVDCGGADCAGACVDLTWHPQVECDSAGCCPPGAICLEGLCWIPVTDGDGDGDDDEGIDT